MIYDFRIRYSSEMKAEMSVGFNPDGIAFIEGQSWFFYDDNDLLSSVVCGTSAETIHKVLDYSCDEFRASLKIDRLGWHTENDNYSGLRVDLIEKSIDTWRSRNGIRDP